MKKPFSHTDLSDVRCSHNKCAMVNGHEGVSGRRIKKNVLARQQKAGTRLLCYPCSVYLKTGKTLRQQKESRGKKVVDNTQTMHAGA